MKSSVQLLIFVKAEKNSRSRALVLRDFPPGGAESDLT